MQLPWLKGVDHQMTTAWQNVNIKGVRGPPPRDSTMSGVKLPPIRQKSLLAATILSDKCPIASVNCDLRDLWAEVEKQVRFAQANENYTVSICYRIDHKFYRLTLTLVRKGNYVRPVAKLMVANHSAESSNEVVAKIRAVVKHCFANRYDKKGIYVQEVKKDLLEGVDNGITLAWQKVNVEGVRGGPSPILPDKRSTALVNCDLRDLGA